MMKTFNTVDVVVVRAFVVEDRSFIVHHDIDNPEYFAVSESSTGALLMDFCYLTPEDAYSAALTVISNKKFHLATVIGNKLVESRVNLNRQNGFVTNLFDILWRQ